MSEPIIDEPIDMEAVGDTAGEASADVSATLEELNSESIEPEQLEELQQKLENQVTEANSKLAESIGLDSPIDTDTINDASLDEPSTEDGKRLKQFSEEFQTKLKAAIEEIKSENGESGKNISEAEQTKQSIFEKYGPSVLKLALVIGAIVGGFILLKDLGDEMSGCYQTFSCSDNVTTPTKVGCSQSNCNCSGVASSKCASPSCGGAGCPSYYWDTVTPLQALAMIPNAITKGVLDPVTKASTTLFKTIAIYGSIFVVFLAIAYLVYRYSSSKFKNN